MMANDRELGVWVEGHYAGQLHRNGTEIAFRYDDSYREARTPALSVSIPKSRPVHDSAVIGRWIDNLLPDNDDVRERWAARFGERRPTAFNLLRHMGADCAGAVQIMPVGESPDSDEGSAAVSDDQIEERLRALRSDDAAWNLGEHGGRWSLGGAQGKFALAQKADGSWAEPTGRAASTHIFKVGITRFEHGDAAEFVTMRAAELLGIPVARTSLRRFGDETAMISRRFDRRVDERGVVHRLHQEDLCQALGLSRALKYESDGGPSVESISDMLVAAVDPRDLAASRELFAQALLYNWITAGTDAHAKNFSLLHFGPRIRLAPLYDLTSAAFVLPAKEVHYKGKLAMKLGGEYGLRGVGRSQLVRAADSLRVEPDWLLRTARGISAGLTAAVGQALDEAHDLIGRNEQELFAEGRRQPLPSVHGALAGSAPALGKSASAGITRTARVDDRNAVWVEPHTRRGKPVDGYWRANPGR